MENRSLLYRLVEVYETYRAERAIESPMPSHRVLAWVARQLMPNLGSVLLVLVLLTVFPGLAAPFNAINAISISTIPYQGRLADASGDPVTGKQNMEFRLYNTPINGTPLWEEFWTGSNSVDVSDGLFSVMLGSINTGLTAVVQGNTTLYLGITVGTDSEMTPRVQLGSVPFSIWSLAVADDSVTSAKVADGTLSTVDLADSAVTSAKIADGTIRVNDAALDTWGITARSQGLIVMPDGTVTQNSNGDVTFSGSVTIMNPLSGTFIRVKAGTYHLDPYGYLYVDLPPTAQEYSEVVPQIGVWQHGAHPFAGNDQFLLAQRSGVSKVWFNFGWTTP